MLVDLSSLVVAEHAIEVLTQQQFDLFVVHGHLLSSHFKSLATLSLSAILARCSLDLMVPSGSSNTSTIS